MKRIMPVAAVLLCSLSAFAQPTDAIQNWTAPPYWTPPVSPENADQNGRSAFASGRQALVTSPVPLPFVALSPCRVMDTRGNGQTGNFGPPQLGVNTTRTISIPTHPTCTGIPATAAAYSLNLAVTNTGAGAYGYLQVWATGQVQPVSANLNYPGGGATLSNAAVVQAGTSGQINVFSGNASADVIIDINGYYSPLGVVNSLNTLAGDVTLAAGANVSITPSANTLTIAAVAGPGGPPSGPAGGSLSGTYPNPGIAAGAVGPTQLANSTAVRSINGAAQDLVTLQGSGNVSVSTAGSTITIGASSGSMVLGAPGDTTLIGAGYTEIAPSWLDYWTATTTTGTPAGRDSHTAVWTGSKMIVWGGFGSGGVLLNDGGQYDPVADTWTATTTAGAPSIRYSHTAVWAGSRMIVWGGWGSTGFLNDGGQYDPVANAWTATTTTNALSARAYHTTVWTGSRMIVWGGLGGGGDLNDGGQYDPGANTWTATTTTGAPSGRILHTAVWTGSRMIVWGGSPGQLNDGGQYDPVADTWTLTTTTNAPSGRDNYAVVWTGSRMIVWGGNNGAALNDGGQYDPGANAWTATTTTGAPSGRSGHTAVWTGSRMIVWGGGNATSYLTDGGQYDPTANTWTAATTIGAPSGRSGHTAVWTGSRMIVWGGGVYLNDGGLWQTVSLYMKN